MKKSKVGYLQPMFKRKTCNECYSGKRSFLLEGYGDAYHSYYRYERCDCTFRKTKPYMKILKEIKSLKDRRKKEGTIRFNQSKGKKRLKHLKKRAGYFYDNFQHIQNGDTLPNDY